MSTFSAISYSQTLPLAQLARNPCWSILGTHRHACNLLATDGTVVAFVNETHGNGPFHIVVPTLQFDPLSTAVQIRWLEDQVQLAQMTIDLRTATPWHPRLPHLTQRPSGETLGRFAELATSQSALYSGPTAVAERAQQGIQHLRQGLLQHDHPQMQHGIHLLAGLGPGLTPAGDDFLLGVLAALWAKRHLRAPDLPLCAEIAISAATQTTRLSGAWLISAGSGNLGEPWHKLIGALNQREQTAVAQAIQTILQVGATSGADALCGFFTGISIQEFSI